MAAKKPLVLTATGDFQQLQTGDYLDITMGGTGATTASTARANLGLTIGTNVEAWSAELDAYAALAVTGMVSRTGAGVVTARTLITPAAGLTITNADGVTGNPTFAFANDLGAIEALNTNGLLVRTATDAWASRQLAVANTGRLTVTNPDGISGNPTLDLAVTGVAAGTATKVTFDTYGRITAASSPSTLTGYGITDALNLGGGTMTGVLTLAGDPNNPLDAATKQYVDARAAGLDPKASVRLLAAANIPLSGLSAIDGVTPVAGDRILAVGQTNAAQNGIYIAASGAWAYAADFSTSAQVTSGAFTFVTEGGTYANTGWVLQNTGGTVTLGTTNLNFVQFTGAGEITAGNGMTKTGNTLALNVTSRFTFSSGQLELAASGVGAGGTYTKVTVDTYGRVTGATTATPADIGAQAASSELSGLALLSSNGMLTRTAAGTYVARAMTAPSAGLTITNPDGVNGSPTFALANDLAAIEALNSNGLLVRTNTDTWASRTISTASSSRLTVTNADGISGNPTLDLATTGISAGTYSSVTVDAYGRVTGGTATGSTPSSNIGLSASNGEATAINVGQAVYVSASGTVKKAVANAAGTKDVLGLVFDTSIASSATGNIITDGVLTATTAQWDAVTGQTGGLTTGTYYYLSNSTAGALTTSAPGTGYLCRVGLAVSSTQLRVTPRQSVQL